MDANVVFHSAFIEIGMGWELFTLFKFVSDFLLKSISDMAVDVETLLAILSS